MNGRLSDQISIPNLLHRSLAQGSVLLNCYIAGSAGGIKRILCSDWLPERARDCPLWFRAKKENCLQRTFKKVRNFWTWSDMESLKAVEDNQNKGELNDSRGFIVLQNSWLSFPFLEINK